MSETAAFFTLLGAIYDLIPANYAGLVLTKHPGVNLVTLQNVRNGKTKDLALLVLLATCSLTDFKKPDYLNNFTHIN